MIQQISFTLYGANNLPRFAYRQDITFWFCFTGAEMEIHKSKTTSKLREKRTSIAVRDILWMFGTFTTPFFLITDHL
jgi:hypothetical protein